MKQRDYLVRGVLGDNQARIFALRTTDVARRAQAIHQTTPVATAALGRTLTMGLVFGAMLKGDETITIQIKGDGPLQGVVVSANSHGQVKGYVGNPNVDLELNSQGKLAVGEAVGKGYLHLIRDLGLKEPYQGTVPLQTGEIGEDFAFYFAHSEQTPSAVLLGVLVGTDGVPLGSGGIIVQLLPDAFNDDKFITLLEERLGAMAQISSLFAGDQSPEEIVEEVFRDLPVRFLERQDVDFECDCSKERFERGLVTLGSKELEELVDLDETIETVCHFCNERYNFTVDELAKLVKELGNPSE